MQEEDFEEKRAKYPGMELEFRSDWQAAMAELRDYTRTHPFSGMVKDGKSLEKAWPEIKAEAQKRADEGQFEPCKRLIKIQGYAVSVMFTVQSTTGGALYSLSVRRPLEGGVPRHILEMILKEVFGTKKVVACNSPTYGAAFKIYMCSEKFD